MTEIKKYATTEDIFRRGYGGSNEIDIVAQIKEEAEGLWSTLNWHTVNYKSGQREIALAKTKLEEAIMWAVKGMTAPREKIEHSDVA